MKKHDVTSLVLLIILFLVFTAPGYLKITSNDTIPFQEDQEATGIIKVDKLRYHHAMERAIAAVTLAATMSDALAVDNNSDGNANPGDVLSYTVVFQNSGTTAAENVVFDDTIDPNTTLVANSLSITPIARNDSYAVTGNIAITVPDGTNDVLGNDGDPDGGTLSVTQVEGSAGNVGVATETDATGLNGAKGAVTMQSNGSFIYAPPPGFTGTDTFAYQVTDDEGDTDEATVTITVSDMVWFVDNSSGGSDLGTYNDPYTSIASLNSAQDESAPNPTSGDVIFIYKGSGDYTEEIPLQDSQILLGQGIDLLTELSNQSITVAAFSDLSSSPASGTGNRPVLTDASGNGITLGENNTIQGLNITNTPSGFGIVDGGATIGTLTISDVSITGTGGAISFTNGGDVSNVTFSDVSSSNASTQGIYLSGIDGAMTISASSGGIITPANEAVKVSGGSASFTFNGAITKSSGTEAAVAVSGGHTGSLTFPGVVNATSGTGIQFNNAVGTSYSFNGTVTLNGGDAGVDIINGTNASFTFSNTTITNPTGVAFNVDGSTGGITYTSGSITKTNNANSAVRFNNHGGGIVNLGVAVTASTSTANAIDLTGTNTGVYTFRGGLDLTTTTGVAFNATGGGIGVNVCTDSTCNGSGSAVSNTVNTTGIATAGVNFVNTVIGTNGVTFTTVNVDGAADGINLTQPGSGAFQVTSGTIQNITSRGVDVSGGSGDIRVDASISTTSTGRSVEVTAHNGGTVDFNGFIDDNGTGIRMENNVGSVMRFDGGLDIDTAAGVTEEGFQATGGGTVAVTGTNDVNTSAGTGIAVYIATTTIGSDDVTFRDVSADGATSGIVLSNTGSSGGFTVTGDGTMTGSVLNRNGSGGTITNVTGDGVSLTNVYNVTLRQMNITNGADQGIFAQDGSNHVFSAVTLEGQATEALEATNVTGTNNRIDHNSRTVQVGTAGGNQAIDLQYNNNTSGTWTIDGGTHTSSGATPNNGTAHTTMRVFDNGSAGTLMVTDTQDNCFYENLFGSAIIANSGNNTNDANTVNLTVDGCTFRNASTAPGGGLNNVEFQATQNASGTLVVQNNVFDEVAIPLAAAGVINAQTTVNASMDVLIQNNTIEDIGDPSGLNGGYIGIRAVTNGNSDGNDIQIIGNSIVRMGQREGILVSLRDTSNDNDVRINNNEIGTATDRHLASNREAIEVLTEDGSDARMEIVGNTIFSSTGDQSIDVDAEDTSTLNLHFTNNTVNATSGTAIDIEVDGTGNLCMDMDGNVTSGTATIVDIDNGGGTYNVEGGSGSLSGDNPGVGSFNILGAIGNVAAGTCTSPSFPVAAPVNLGSVLENGADILPLAEMANFTAAIEPGNEAADNQPETPELEEPVIRESVNQVANEINNATTSDDVTIPDSSPLLKEIFDNNPVAATGSGSVDVLDEEKKTAGRDSEPVYFASAGSMTYMPYVKPVEIDKSLEESILNLITKANSSTGSTAAVFSGENINIDLGTLDPGQEVTITFQTTIDSPFPSGTSQVSNQATISGSNFSDVLTDDPDTGSTNDATVTPVAAEPPAKAVLTSPSDGTTNVGLTPEFSWESLDDADTYDLQVSENSGLTSPVIDETGISATTFELTSDLDTSTMYYWRVRGVNSGGDGEWSDVFSFTTVPEASDVVILIDPTDGAPDVPVDPLFDWNTANGADTYDLVVSANSDFSSPVIDEDGITETEFQTTTDLSFATMYYWRVRGVNGSGPGTWSTSFDFTTESRPTAADGRILASNSSQYLFEEADFNADGNTNAIKVENLPDQGTLMLEESPVAAGEEISLADINAEKLTWQSPGGYGYMFTSFEFRAMSSAGALSMDSYTMTIDLAATSVELTFINDTEGEGWRFFGNPSDGDSYDDLLAPIWTKGMPGSDSPGATFANVLNINQEEYAWEEPASLTDATVPGQPFIVYVYADDDNDGTPEGFPKTLSSGDNWLPLDGTFSFTELGYGETNNPDNTYLLANPHPIALDFCEIFDEASTNIANNIDVWDPAANDGNDEPDDNGDYVNMSCLDGEVLIAPFQAFWVRTTAAGPEINIPEETYSESMADGYFKQAAPDDAFIVTLNVSGDDQVFSNQTRIYFSDEGTTELDPTDALKKIPAGLASRWLALYSMDEQNHAYTLQNLPINMDEKVRVPLDIQTTESGEFTMNWVLPASHVFGGSYFLRDNQTGDVIELREGSSYRFTVSEDQVEKGPAADESNEVAPKLVTRNPEAESPRFELLIAQSGIDGFTELGAIPENFELGQNYPNPFNPTTVISYQLPVTSDVRLEVYDMLGRNIATLVNGQIAAGRHTVNFDASNLSSGIYLYRLQAGNQIITKKLTVVK